MCSVAEDIEELSNYRHNVVKNKLNGDCKKCGLKAVILLQKKDPFCRKCYNEYCDHKFRSTIGKNKKIKHGDKVLLACSGGRKSTALLHMTKKALESGSVKQISFEPAVLYINEAAVGAEVTEDRNSEIIGELLTVGYPLLYTNIEMVHKMCSGNDFYQRITKADSLTELLNHKESQNFIKECLGHMQLSAKIDFIKHLRLLLMTEIAFHAGFKYVFVGDTACSLAANLLTDISLGRGSQISANTNFLDSRYKVAVCRPLREFLNKEVAMYNHFNKCLNIVVPDLLTKTDVKSSVQRLTESFISNLQEDFPATVFTIFRTGGKLFKQIPGLDRETCFLCKSKLDNINPDPCSALEALKLSQRVSVDERCSESSSLESFSKDDGDELEARNILQFLCNGCSIPFRVKPDNVLHFRCLTGNLLKMNRQEMRGQIENYILDENS